MAKGDAEFSGTAPFGVTRSALFCDFDEAKCAEFPDSGADGVSPHSIVLELIERHWQFAIVHATMVRELDLDARERTMRREAKHAIGW
jgi:hypothetical protein